MHSFHLRVYYEDTDLAGIVYYANYLRFIERARTEFVRALGIDQTQLKTEQGLVFVVLRVELDYKAPARFDDLLEVQTVPLAVSGARTILRQTVLRGDDICCSAVVTLGAMRADGRPGRLPEGLRTPLTERIALT